MTKRLSVLGGLLVAAVLLGACVAPAAVEETAQPPNQCTYNAYGMAWGMDWADAGNIIDTLFGPTSDFQYTFWQLDKPELATEFEELADDAYRDTNLHSRAATWQQAEDILASKEVAVLPLFFYDRMNLISTDLNTNYPPFGAPEVSTWSFTSGKTTLVAPLAFAIPTLDPSQAADTTSSFVVGQLLDTPFTFAAGGGIEPLAATSFEVSEDGTVFTVHLREDAVWSDGVPVLAQHFVDGVTRLLSPDMANDYAYVMFDLVGAPEYNAGDRDTLDSIVALDDYTFQFTLSEPRSYYDSLLAFHFFHPIRLDLLEKYGEDWLRPGNFASNGAYVLAEHEPGDQAVLVKNESYWNADNVSIETIELPIMEEPATSLAAFEAGEVDMTNASSGGFPADDIPRLMESDSFVRLPRPGLFYLGLNTNVRPTDNLNFRKALVSAVDRRTLLDKVTQTPWRIEAYGVIPPEIDGYQGDATGLPYDVEAAQGYLQAYMDEAGIADPGEIVVELWYNTSSDNQQILEAIEAMLEANLGIDVRTVSAEYATYLETLEECNVIGEGGF